MNLNQNHSFSIITITYNRYDSGFLQKNIESVQNQIGFKDYEHIIINNGSTDLTYPYLIKIKNSAMKILNTDRIDIATAWQLGIAEANGDFCIFLDDDDFLPENSLSKRRNLIKLNPQVDWFYGLAQWVDQNEVLVLTEYNSEFFNTFLYERNLIINRIHNGTPTIKTSILKTIKFPDWVAGSQDYYLWLELLRPERELKVDFIKEVLVFYRIHESQRTNLRLRTKELIILKNKIDQKIRFLHSLNLAFLANEANEYLNQYKECLANVERSSSLSTMKAKLKNLFGI